MSIKIEDIFPYETPSAEQLRLLTALIKDYDHYDVFVIAAPVASGKMGIGRSILELAKLKGQLGNFVVPNNALVSQVLEEFPGELSTIYTKRSYPTVDAFHEAKEVVMGSLSALNTYSLLANKLYKDVLVADECHTLLPILRDIAQIRWWDKNNVFPHSPRTVAEAIAFLSPFTYEKQTTTMLNALDAPPSTYALWWTHELRYNQDTKCLHYYSLTGRNVATYLWPQHKTSKIFLMSATTQLADLYELGLDDRRVKVYDMESAIPPDRRPLIVDPIGNMSVASAKSNLSALTEYIEDALEHKEGKGLIHATYGISAMLKATHLGSHPRLIFHTNKDKKGRFKQWQNTEDGVLVGCGMTEGINLKNDMGRWQLITKVLWPHLGHPVVIAKRWGENGENWYNWQAAKDVIQSYGRICRWPKDFGETRIVDSSFINLYNKHRGLFPNWFKEAVS